MTHPLCASCSGVRPFGVSLLCAGYDDDGPQLYQVRYIKLVLRVLVS
jgi:20S proteasome alpha/beta subunit